MIAKELEVSRSTVSRAFIRPRPQRRGRRTGRRGPTGLLCAARRLRGEPGQESRLITRFTPQIDGFALATAAGLVLLGLPFLSVHFGNADDRQLPESAESRTVQEHIRDDFPGSPGNAVEVIAQNVSQPSALADYAKRLSALPAVVRVEGPMGEYVRGERTQPPGPAEAARLDGGTAYLTVLRDGPAADAGGQDLVREVRAEHASFRTSVAGRGAELVDSKAAIADRLPWALAMIVIVTVVLVFLLTGSVLVPLQAVVLNSAGAGSVALGQPQVCVVG